MGNDTALAFATSEFGFCSIDPILAPYVKDHGVRRRMWPWLALAILNYKTERLEFAAPATQEMKPSEIKKLLTSIASDLDKLNKRLTELNGIEYLPTHPDTPWQRQHYQYLSHYLHRAVAGFHGTTFADDEPPADIMDCWNETMGRLGALAQAAIQAKALVDDDLIKRPKGLVDPALPSLACKLKIIWTKATGRPPGTRAKAGEVFTDFEKFIQGCVSLGGGAEPTKDQLRTCLKRAGYSGKNKSL
jgi:hypothetical protein